MSNALLIAAFLVGAGHQTDTDDFRPSPAWAAMGKDLWYDKANKRLVMRAVVALREGSLEHLLCRRHTKEHEAVLATEADPKLIKAALLLAGVEEGHPVRYEPKFEAPSGGRVKIELEWKEKGETKKALAKNWIKDFKDQPLAQDWVFAGSSFYVDPITKKEYFGADDGDLITVANFPTAILDLPIASTANDAERSFLANTKNIPAQGVKVTMYLSPFAKESPESKTESSDKTKSSK